MRSKACEKWKRLTACEIIEPSFLMIWPSSMIRYLHHERLASCECTFGDLAISYVVTTTSISDAPDATDAIKRLRSS